VIIKAIIIMRVDPLVACSNVEKVFVTVVRSVTVCFCSVCESHAVDMLTRMHWQVHKIVRIMYSNAKLVAGSFMQKNMFGLHKEVKEKKNMSVLPS